MTTAAVTATTFYIMNFNPSNWVILDSVLSKINCYTKMESYSTGLPILGLIRVDDPSPVLRDSSLMIVLTSSHFHVLLFHADHELVYACDSLNMVSRLPVRRTLSSYLGVSVCSIRPLYFENQVGVDHCGASSVAIALELLRQFKQGELGSQIVVRVPSLRLRSLIRQLHKGPSKSARGWTCISRRAKLTCRFCNFTSWYRRGIKMHERSHL